MAFEPLLYLALGLLILGNGFFKPNISTMVGQLYPPGDPRRDGAYTIFYMGINLGALLLAPGLRHARRERVGWHYGFGAAGVGMVFGLIASSLSAAVRSGRTAIRPAVSEPASLGSCRSTGSTSP